MTTKSALKYRGDQNGRHMLLEIDPRRAVTTWAPAVIEIVSSPNRTEPNLALNVISEHSKNFVSAKTEIYLSRR